MDEALRRELLEMRKSQLDARRAGSSGAVREIDRRNVERLKAIIAEHGWPGRSLVGEDGSFAAWWIAQHASFDRPFQALCLERLKEAVAANEAEMRLYAYLEDAVRVGGGEPQRFGTQFRYESDYQVVVEPLEDPDAVDARRQEAGLEPLRQYLSSALAGRFARRVLGGADTEIALHETSPTLTRATMRQGPVATELEIEWDDRHKWCRLQRTAPVRAVTRGPSSLGSRGLP
ncbi:MAG TPA: DUF6624 domain-containing protein [Limnochordia bacterium]